MRAPVRPVAAVALVAAALAVGGWTLGGGEAVRDAAPFGLFQRASFGIRLSGPLWNDRTLRDRDGTPDIAFLTADEPLAITATGRDGARIASISYRLDAGPRRPLSACSSATCPTSATVTARPALLRVSRGSHRLTIEVRGPGAEHTARASLELTVGDRLPPIREGEPVVATAASGTPAVRPDALARQAQAIIGRAQRSGVLRDVLGTAAPRYAQIGALQAGGRPLGATALLELPTPRRNVHATVPGYLTAGSGYRLQSVRFTAPKLTDVLVDIDLRRGRIIAVEPGPGSQTSQWTPQQPGPPLSTAGDAPSRPPALVRLSERGPAFLAYDGRANFRAANRDWPVSLIFTGHATVGKVKRALKSIGFTRHGEARYLPYLTGASSARFDGDRGLKTPCAADGTDVHLRLYAPTATDRFVDPQYGSVVVATAHLDRAEGCSTPPTLFGFSEVAERRVADIVSKRLGWRVQRNRLALGNAEPYRRDITNKAHVWWSDGRATLIDVP